jgi:hypothetical protein
MAMMGKIRSMHFRQGKSISEIARLTSLSRNTIKKWLKAPQGAQPKYRRREMPKKLARTGGIVGSHQASPPSPRPQDRVPEVAQRIGLPSVPEDHRRDEAPLARSSSRPVAWRCCAPTLQLEAHMGSDAPPAPPFL